MFPHFTHFRPIIFVTGMLTLLLAASLAACTPESTPIQPPAATTTPTGLPVLPSDKPAQPPLSATPTPTAPTASPSPATLLTEEFLPTPFTNSLEAFGIVYDANATLEIPPAGSNEMLFWGQALPVMPLETTPEFISYPTPQPPAGSGELLEAAGCQVDEFGIVTCPADSPLARFGCDFMYYPKELASGLDPQNPLVAECGITTEEWEAARAGGVVLSGCAFKSEIHYVFMVGDEYVLVSSKEALQELIAPIDTPAEALSYARLVTGLRAIHSFSYEPTFMYFQESIAGTHVTKTDGGFEMNLFNFAACSCEPWINTQILIQVDREGQVTWADAVPVLMTTGYACAD